MNFVKSGMLLSFVLLSGCHLTNTDVQPDSHATISAADKDAWTKDLTDRREIVRTWATTCKDTGWISERRYGECYEWDTGEFGSMACLAATLANDTVTASARCTEVKNSQDPSGRWHRGQQTRLAEQAACAGKAPETCQTQNAFSRDEVNGLFSYWIATRDADAAQKWFNWFSNHTYNGKVRIEKTCDNPSDDRCQLVPSSWGMFYKVWKHMGLTPTMKMGQQSIMPYFDVITYHSSVDYDRELAATTIIMHRVMNIWSDNPQAAKAEKDAVDNQAKKLYGLDANNAMMYFVANGVDKHLVYDLILASCPKDDPGKMPDNPEYADFIWQRASTDWIFKHPAGHDCIFMIDMALAALHPEANPSLQYHW